jgi:MurNAc alpha-1-phosphate uridylyltransferase
MKAMILAAGRGKRLDPITATIPKPLIKVAEKPLLQHHIENLASIGINEIVINTCWLGDQIESYFGDGKFFGVNIKWSRESDLLDTGGGIRKALPLLGSEPFLLINSDIWSNFPLDMLLNKKLHPKIRAHLVLIPNPNHNFKGDFTIDTQNIVGLRVPQRDTYTFSGISILDPKIFCSHNESIKKFPLRDILAEEIAHHGVTGSIWLESWWDIGTPERLDALNKFLTKE